MSCKANKSSWSGVLSLAFWGTYALALAVLAGTIFLAAHSLRAKCREQITGQHAKIVYEAWSRQKRTFDQAELTADTAERASDQLPAVLETARRPELANLGLGTRIFDPAGGVLFADPNLAESQINEADLAQLRRFDLIARLREAADLSEVDPKLLGEPVVRRPLLDVYIPLHSTKPKRLLAIAQFIFDGTQVVDEFRMLDANLTQNAIEIFAVGGALLGLVLGLGFHQLQRVNRVLNERTQSLLKANQELALAAKTSAVGAVTAHLIHGLKNPLSGLQTFVTSRGAASDEEESEWALAASSARRMQAMINEIVRVLRDEETDSPYEMSLGEFVGMLRGKVQSLAREAAVDLRVDLSGQARLRNREANLVNLILYNLVHNAIEATPRGKSVEVTFVSTGGQVVCQVKDEGPGIPESQQANLFKPCRSSKDGGSGIGLAISRQLATCIGAELEMARTGPDGTTFVLTFRPDGETVENSWAAENALPTAKS